MRLGKRIYNIRRSHGLTQEEFCGLCFIWGCCEKCFGNCGVLQKIL